MSHIQFVQSVIQEQLGENTSKYLAGKQAAFDKECKEQRHEPYVNGMSHEERREWDESNCAKTRMFFGRQVAHVLLIPAKVIGLALQTAADAAWVAAEIAFCVLTAGLIPDLNRELKSRVYNLLVVDTLTWLSIPVSLLNYKAYMGANALHLGTIRPIDFEDLSKKVEEGVQTEEVSTGDGQTESNEGPAPSAPTTEELEDSKRWEAEKPLYPDLSASQVEVEASQETETGQAETLNGKGVDERGTPPAYEEKK